MSNAKVYKCAVDIGYREGSWTCRRAFEHGAKRRANRGFRHTAIDLASFGLAFIGSQVRHDSECFVDMGEDCDSHVVSFEQMYDICFCDACRDTVATTRLLKREWL